MAKREVSLAELFSPRGVAVVGASPGDGYSFTTLVVQSLKEAGFPIFHSLRQAAKAMARIVAWNQA